MPQDLRSLGFETGLWLFFPPLLAGAGGGGGAEPFFSGFCDVMNLPSVITHAHC